MNTDEQFMKAAYREADEAGRRGEVPIGAVLVKDGSIIAADHNRREELNDATAHAEILVISKGGSLLGGWRLNECTLYVTLEPCPMCAGAMVQARLGRLVFGAPDPKAGSAGTLYDIARDDRLNHRLQVTAGVLGEECASLLHRFFSEKR
ncbi:MAG: tRNA adenosine(34) deaminase TadA [Bacillota bacterium]|nr:tRNA adenosine(34) deaminase TadA [Bacillota bacterium]